MATTVLSDLGVLAVVFAGVLVVEAIRARYGLRLGGVVAVPLAAVLTLTNAWVLPIYAVGLALLFGVTALVHRRTLVYGRVLLATTLIFAMGYCLAVAALGAVLGALPVTGFQLFFTALFAGTGAYSLHLVAPADRLVAGTLTAGLFVATLASCRLMVTPPDGGALPSLGFGHVGAIAVVLAAAGVTLAHLERRDQVLASHRTGLISR